MNERHWSTVKFWLSLAAALFFLNATVTFHNVWPTPWITTRHEFSIELAVVLLASVLYSAWRKPPSRRFFAALTVLIVLMSIGRYAEVTAPALYGRPVNVYWDAQYLPKVAAMLADVASPWLIAAVVLGVVGLLAAVSAAVYWSLGRVREGLGRPLPRRALGAVASALVGIYAVGHVLNLRAQYWFSVPVGRTYGDQAAFILDALTADARASLPIEPLPPSNLKQVAGADVLLTFLESYGASTYDEPSIASVVDPERNALEEAAAATGRRVVSAFIASPTFGGGSWLAHSSLMSGHEVRNQGDYNVLLTQDRETLPKRFAAAGYRALAVMPGLKNEWPEGAFYGFDKIYGEHDLDYRGPAFGWWRIPDQYSLAKLDDLVRSAGPRTPAFVFMPTINTHIPFRPTPPYQADWSRMLGLHPYDDEAAAAAVKETPEWTNLREGYADSFAYTFRYLAGYLRARPDADFVLVLIGDHQPAASVSGEGARWDVPVHIVTSRNAIAESLRSVGFIEGVRLGAGRPAIGNMPMLTGWLLQAFDAGAPQPSGYGPDDGH